MGRSISVVQPNSSPMMRYDYKMVAVHSANNKWQCCCVALLIFCGFPSENWTVFEENNIICTQIESLFYLLFFRQVVVGLCIFGWLYRLSSYWTKPNKQKGRLFIRWLVHDQRCVKKIIPTRTCVLIEEGVAKQGGVWQHLGWPSSYEQVLSKRTISPSSLHLPSGNQCILVAWGSITKALQ